MRRVFKVLLVVAAIQLVMYAIAQTVRLVMRRQAPGSADPLADEFDLVNIMDGTEWGSHASALRAGTVKNVMGGVELDLSDAQLSPEGARLEVSTIMGGTEIAVPRGWRVIVIGDAVAGSNEVDVTPEDDLSDDSPTLTIIAKTVCGGLEVRSTAPRPVTA